MKKITAIFTLFFIFFQQLFCATTPQIEGGDIVRDVTYEDCQKSTKYDTCQCITLSTRETVCSIASITPENASTENQKFIIAWNKIVLNYTTMQIKVFEKALSQLDNDDYTTMKSLIASLYEAEEDSLSTFRDKIRENLDSDIGNKKDPTGDPNANETLDDVVKTIQPTASKSFLSQMATQYRNQLKELEQQNINSSAIDTGNVLLNLIMKAVMALSGLDLTKSMEDAIENAYIGKVKLPFCVANRYFEFDSSEDADSITQTNTTENYDSELAGTGFSFGNWDLKSYDMSNNSYNKNYKMGTKVDIQGLLKTDENGSQIYSNTVVLNATTSNELNWATSLVNQSFIYDQYANVQATADKPIVRSGTGLRQVMINRGDLRNSALNIFSSGRYLLEEATAKSFKINCTPSIVSQKGSTILVQEYDIYRPGDTCQSDETAYCPMKENNYYVGNGKEGGNHSAYLAHIFSNGLTMQCSATEYTKKVKCPGAGGFLGQKCTIRWRDCYTYKKFYDYALKGIESNDSRCVYGKRYNDWSKNTHDMEYYTGFHDLEFVNESQCDGKGLYK